MAIVTLVYSGIGETATVVSGFGLKQCNESHLASVSLHDSSAGDQKRGVFAKVATD